MRLVVCKMLTFFFSQSISAPPQVGVTLNSLISLSYMTLQVQDDDVPLSKDPMESVLVLSDVNS